MGLKNSTITPEETIRQLLFKQDVVIIPDFGGFMKEYRPASFDYLQGVIHPPSSIITFNENLVTDDGVLVDYYKEANACRLQAAKDAIAIFTKKCKDTLARKEVISIPEVGRILKDYEGNIKFLEEKTNFNTSSFGLNPVKYVPIIREEPKPVAEAMPAIPEASKEKTLVQSLLSSKVLRVAVPVAALVLVSIWGLPKLFNGTGSDGTASVVPPDEGKPEPVVNVSPSERELSEDEEYLTTEDDFEHSDDYDETVPEISEETLKDYGMETTEEPETSPEPEVESTPAPEPTVPEAPVEEPDAFEPTIPGAEDVITVPSAPEINNRPNNLICVGRFSKQKGVDLTTAKIVGMNLLPYTEVDANGVTMVCVQFEDGADVGKLLAKCKEKIAPDAFIKR